MLICLAGEKARGAAVRHGKAVYGDEEVSFWKKAFL